MTDKTKKLREYFENQGYSQDMLAQKLCVDKAHVNKLLNGKKEFGRQTAKKWSDLFGLSYSWLLTGEGEMLIGATERTTTSGIPYYPDIPVSAGKAELQESDSTEFSEGSINIAGVTGKYAFPVIGCSMEPIIHAGDIIVVDEVNRLDSIDPDKIYLIITRDDRMIKRLEIDDEDADKLWCVSHNYKRFSIRKDEIMKLYRVTFYGRLV